MSPSTVHHIINVSGGKDSTATYLLALERLKGNFHAVFADTGNEHEATYEFVECLHERTGGPKVEIVRADFSADLLRHRDYILREWPKQGIPQEKVERAAALHEPTGNPFLDLCISKGRFPSRMAQFCTAELKQWPITDQIVLPALRKGPVLQWLGIRADESPNRAKQPRYNRDDSGAYLWRPIFRWTVADVWAQHRRHGLARNALYDQGMTRVGCMPCINCRKDELRLIALRFPEHIDRIRQWEEIVSTTNKRSSATFFPAVTDPMDVERPGSYSRIDTIVEWSKTGRGGRQYAMFFDDQAGGGCSNEQGLCERAA
ncbi:phosphoadenosine phosphosulfate reductase domain-containing protein [Solimonas marina]|uniref:Phosphoadenosine phosphosulfate reductase family protein n=1 Tax=Solimonas marina TaxID=2714601 RepID=A0A969W7T0_9GAMM|nr:phosphoadenosine phosphosulfate reductase family protein [Solimonas marina]NKF21553.1 phosphoadenosine phosphosulfate reductase family protein [Solimonas marina]